MKTAKTFVIHLTAVLAVACGGPQKMESAPEAPAASSTPVTSSTPASSAAPAASQAAAPSEPSAPAASASPLIISIEPRSESKLKGTAKFEAVSGGVQITLDVTSAPSGKHGAHIHQNADCSAKDAKSAG